MPLLVPHGIFPADSCRLRGRRWKISFYWLQLGRFVLFVLFVVFPLSLQTATSAGHTAIRSWHRGIRRVSIAIMMTSAADTHETSRNRRDNLLVVLLLALFLAGNATIVVAMERYDLWAGHPRYSDCLQGAFAGSYFAQFALHSIWTVFSHGSIVRRGLFSGTAALLLILSFFGTLQLIEEYAQEDELLTILFCAPVVLLAAESPLWMLQAMFGWRVLSPTSTCSIVRRRPLSIGSLLMATAAVALCFACIRIASFINETSVASIAISTVIVAGIVCAVGFLTLVPSLIATMYTRHIVVGLAFSVASDALVFVALIIILSIIDGSPPPPDIAWMFIPLFVSFVLVLHTPLLIARRLGYRLHLRRVARDVDDNPFDSDASATDQAR